MALETETDGVNLVVSRGGRVSRLPVAHGGWSESTLLPTPTGRERVAATGAWTAEHTYTAKVALHETPFVVTLRLGFKGEELTLDQDYNVAFGETKRPRLIGRR